MLEWLFVFCGDRRFLLLWSLLVVWASNLEEQAPAAPLVATAAQSPESDGDREYAG
ncbi:MAG TPA: hypothetical protein VGG85_04555 [Terracidiphilus sp.]|jgi:hypothetical protein